MSKVEQLIYFWSPLVFRHDYVKMNDLTKLINNDP